MILLDFEEVLVLAQSFEDLNFLAGRSRSISSSSSLPSSSSEFSYNGCNVKPENRITDLRLLEQNTIEHRFHYPNMVGSFKIPISAMHFYSDLITYFAVPLMSFYIQSCIDLITFSFSFAVQVSISFSSQNYLKKKS